MNRIFIPHPEIPNHYTVSKEYFIRTSDLDQEEFNWSRVIESNYIKGRGFLSYLHPSRVYVYGYIRPRNQNEDHIALDDYVVAEELSSIVEKDTLTILHYCGSGYLHDVITGVAVGIPEKLSDSFKRLYYNPL